MAASSSTTSATTSRSPTTASSGNQGNYGGGITVGFPAAGASNTNVTIRYNSITKNGGVQGGGGVVLNEGSHNYKVLNNFIAGNFGRFSGRWHRPHAVSPTRA